nr:hypothetical protein [Mycoplasmopsis agalactiae]
MEKDAAPKVSKIEKEITSASKEAEKLNSELQDSQTKYESVNRQYDILKTFSDFTDKKINELENEHIEIDGEITLDIKEVKKKFEEVKNLVMN